MPGLDRSGPMGSGPMTGGGRGFCNTVNAGYSRRLAGDPDFGGGIGYGRGFRGGFGPGISMRRGFCRGYAWNMPAYPADKTDQVATLKDQVDSIKSALDTIIRRIADMEKASA